MAVAYASVRILPDLETVIVVLSNTIALAGAPDFVGQLLVEAVLDEPLFDRSTLTSRWWKAFLA
jgi:hypothetical protein